MNPNFNPRPYQIDDVVTLANNPRTGLGHDPGGGKTFIAAMFTNVIHKQTGESVVWTMPGGIMKKNRDDILYSTHFAPEEVRIVQGTKAQREEIYKDEAVKVFLMSGVGYSNEWEQLPKRVRHSVHDELQLYYVTHNAKRTQNWYNACKNKGAIVPMTGTIVKGRLNSTYPTLHVIAPWAYGNDRMFLAYHAWFDEYGSIIGWKNHERLQEVLKKCFIFRSFKSIYGQESKVIQVERCEVGPLAYKVYKDLEASGLIELEDSFVDAGTPGVSALRCRQVLACPEIFEVREKTGKDKALEVDIEEALKTGERLAIFSVFTAEQTRIVTMIYELGGRVGHINGAVSYEKRQELDTQFRSGEIQFMVASPKTAGIGFNWEFLNNMVFVSVDYDDDSFVQAYRRGIRGKRESPLRIKLLKYEETVENRIFNIIDRKSRDWNKVNPETEILTLSLL